MEIVSSANKLMRRKENNDQSIKGYHHIAHGSMSKYGRIVVGWYWSVASGGK